MFIVFIWGSKLIWDRRCHRAADRWWRCECRRGREQTVSLLVTMATSCVVAPGSGQVTPIAVSDTGFEAVASESTLLETVRVASSLPSSPSVFSSLPLTTSKLTSESSVSSTMPVIVSVSMVTQRPYVTAITLTCNQSHHNMYVTDAMSSTYHVTKLRLQFSRTDQWVDVTSQSSRHTILRWVFACACRQSTALATLTSWEKYQKPQSTQKTTNPNTNKLALVKKNTENPPKLNVNLNPVM